MVASKVAARIIASYAAPYRAITIELDSEEAIIENLKVITSSNIMMQAFRESSRPVNIRSNQYNIKKYELFVLAFISTPSGASSSSNIIASIGTKVGNAHGAAKSVSNGAYRNEYLEKPIGTIGPSSSTYVTVGIYSLSDANNTYVNIYPAYGSGGSQVIYILRPYD